MLLKYHLDRFGRVNVINTTPHYFAQIIANIFLCTDEGELAEYEAFLYGREIISTMPVDVNKAPMFTYFKSIHMIDGNIQLTIDPGSVTARRQTVGKTSSYKTESGLIMYRVNQPWQEVSSEQIQNERISAVRDMLLHFVGMIEERHDLLVSDKRNLYTKVYAGAGLPGPRPQLSELVYAFTNYRHYKAADHQEIVKGISEKLLLNAVGWTAITHEP